MKIPKAKYAEHVPGTIDYHWAAFVTRTGELVRVEPYLNNNDAVRVARDINEG